MTNRQGTAGKNAHDMAQQRYKKVAIYASLLFLIGSLLLTNLNNMAKLGLPVSIFIAIAVKCIADDIERKGLYVEKRAKDADRGAHAEEVVAEKLTNLPDGYHVFHDISFDGFNIDHVVVGPGGIFLVETKSHKGKIDAQGDTLLLNGAQPPKNFLNQTWSQTYQLRDFLKKQTSKEWTITPILCFTQAFVSVRTPVMGITVVNNRYLTTYLLKQQQRLNSEDIQTITGILQSRILNHK
jgi:hypothetical protein